MCREFGLTCDHILEVDVVTADGELRVVNKDQHPVCENGMKRERLRAGQRVAGVEEREEEERREDARRVGKRKSVRLINLFRICFGE